MGKLGNVKYQITNMFKELEDFGTKKHEIKSENYKAYQEAKAKGETTNYNPVKANEKIQGRTTFKSYLNICIKAGEFIKQTYGVKDMSTIKDNPTYLAKYLNNCINRDLSAHTIKTYASALVKGFGLESTKDLAIKLPDKNVDTIFRNRGEKDHHSKFNAEKQADVLKAAVGTGMRREELSNLKPYMISEKMYNGEKRVFVTIAEQDKNITKGAKTREILVLREYGDHLMKLKEGKEPNEKIFSHITTKINIHQMGRREYANKMYEELKKDFGENLSYKNAYYTRIVKTDENGNIVYKPDGNKEYLPKEEQKVWDKSHMTKISKWMGHERYGVIGTNYLNRK
jgi:integrase